ncbi:ubiquinol-cytochrome C chaperone-domain-containing protein [Baffinella frigidus]|nr:ubiquinol-cytochrome C chaperone-domain-containing protein [Cryptophyta sp. CCMP2293]
MALSRQFGGCAGRAVAELAASAAGARVAGFPPAWVGVGRAVGQASVGGAPRVGQRLMSTSERVKGPGDIKRKNFYVSINAVGGRFAWLLNMLGYNSEEAKQIRSSSTLYLRARDQSGRAEFREKLGLVASFENRYYLECLHVWMILMRLRSEGPNGKLISQDLFDNFHTDLTTQMSGMGVQAIQLSTRARELQSVFYGAAVSYDYSLGGADALLASALYRNIFGCNVRAVHLNEMVAYVRREVHTLNKMDSETFLRGRWTFGSPALPEIAA